VTLKWSAPDVDIALRMDRHNPGCPTCRAFRQVGTSEDGIGGLAIGTLASAGRGSVVTNEQFEVRDSPFTVCAQSGQPPEIRLLGHCFLRSRALAFGTWEVTDDNFRQYLVDGALVS
jgi:hypothetical protein